MSDSVEYIYSESPAIELLQRLGYIYNEPLVLKNLLDDTGVILKETLQAAIKRINPQLNDLNVEKAIEAITSISASSLMEANQQVWELLRHSSLTLKQSNGKQDEYIPVWFIDYVNPDNNDFIVVNQFRFSGHAGASIPDIVIYVNGLPLAIIECKSPTALGAWDAAYNDIKFYQQNSEKLFYYNQICVGVWQVEGKYGAINSPKAFYSNYKTGDLSELESLLARPATAQDKLLYSLFQKQSFLDIVRHFVLFELDEGRVIKKLPRYQQIRTVNKAITKLKKEDKGGVIWHTQGSGKSLSMVYLTRKLQAPEFGFNNPTILIMTDRNDLDIQISGTFINCGFKNQLQQATSVKHLDKLLRNDYGSIITTTIQKFQETEQESPNADDTVVKEEDNKLRVERSIKDRILTKVTKVFENGKWVEIKREQIQLEELSEKENLYVMVDEAHRSHYGFLAAFMRTALPKAKFIAFTGTPIAKEDKSTLAEFYGEDYLDVYTLVESKEDGATVDLLYDEGIARLDVKKKELDQEFEEKFGHYSEEKKERLKKEALTKYALSTERITEICKHIIEHYSKKIFPDGHKALIVCDGRPAALRYQQILLQLKEQDENPFQSKLIVSMGTPKSDEIAKDYYEAVEWNKKHPFDQKIIYPVAPEQTKTAANDFKLPFGNEDEREKSGKKKYDNTAFLVVSDMLLTGYDVPIASCLYLDKPLKEHTLLQAIARVNRSRDGKAAGFIVDYSGITANLIQALEIYSGDVKPEDILKNINEEIPRLELNHNRLVEFFKSLKFDRKYQRDQYIDAAVLFIEPLNVRDEFKELLKQFNKSINIILPHSAAMRFREDFDLYNEIKLRARNAYPDDDGLSVSKEESKMLQELIDKHLKAKGVDNLLKEPVSIIDKEKFKAEILNASPATKELKMRNNLTYVIKVGLDRNPDFFKPLAERLEELLKLREEERITQLELLKAYTDIQDIIINENKEGKEKGFITEREIAVYNSMKTIFDGEAQRATQKIFSSISGELEIIGWEEKGMVRNDMAIKIAAVLREKMDRPSAKSKAIEVVDLLKKNKNV